MASNLASFAIDIAARMSGLESTNAELDAVTSKLMGAGRGAEHFQLASRELSTQLDAARAATSATGNALSIGSDNFRIAEKEAIQAAKGFDKLSAELIKLDAALAAAEKAGDVGKVASLNAAYDELATSVQLADVRVERANSSLAEQAAKLGVLDKQAREAAESERKLTHTMGNLRKMSAHVDRQLNEAADGFSMMRSGVDDLGGPVGTLGDALMRPIQGFLDLRQTVGATTATTIACVAGIGLLVAALAAVTVALVVGVAAVAKWAVGLADANRNAAMATEVYRAMNPELARLESSFLALEQATGLGTDALRDVASQVDAAKVSAEALPDVLLAAAQAEAAMGKGGAGKFLDAMRKSSKSAVAFSKDVQAKLGGVVSRQLLSLDKQSERFRKNIGSLFGGLNVDPALSGLQTIVALFDKTTESGSALEFLFGKIFQPLIDKAENAGFVIEAFVLGFEIGLMKIYLAARPVIAAVTELFGFEDLTLEDVCKAVTKAAQVLAVAFTAAAVVFGTVATVIGVVIAAYVAFQGALLATAVALQGVGVAAIYALGEGLQWLWDQTEAFRNLWVAAVGAAVGAATSLASGIGSAIASVLQAVGALPGAISAAVSSALASFEVGRWVTVGSQIVAGLAQGISGAAGTVIRAITGVASGAIQTAKRILGIASPSRVFRGVGRFTGQGFALGVEGETDTAQDAMAELVAPPDSPLIAPPSMSGVFPTSSVLTPLQSVAAAPAGSSTPRDTAALPGASAPGNSSTPGGRSVTINLAGAQITFRGVQDVPDSLERFAEMLTQALEGDALSAGAA